MQKPLSLARKDYIDTICDTTNKCGLPAFVVVEVLERLLSEMRAAAEAELKRDTATWRNAVQQDKGEVADGGD